MRSTLGTGMLLAVTARDDSLTTDPVGHADRIWGLLMFLGALSIIAGAIVLAKPENSLRTIAVVVGIFIVVDGITELALALLRGTANRGSAIVVGALSVIAGILLIRHPIAGVQAVALFIGIWLIAVGMIRFVMAFDSSSGRLARLVIAAVQAFFGVAIVSSTHIGFATLALVVGISFIADGIGMIAAAILVRSLGRSQGAAPGPAVPA